MSDTHVWNVAIAAPINVIIDILESQSIFEPGPIEPGSMTPIANVVYTNIGTTGGAVYMNFYTNPNTPQEEISNQITTTCDPGEIKTHGKTIIVPNTPGATMSWGVKIWGEGEPEPAWGSAGAKIFTELPSYAIPVLAIGALAILTYFMIKK